MARRITRQSQADHIEQMTRAALLYYTQDKSQAEIADELGVSRPTVARLLQKAREEGIVEIRVRTYPGLSMQLEQRLRETFGLDYVRLVLDQPDEALQRDAVAQAAAAFLSQHLHDGMTVAVGMGRNVGAVPSFMQPALAPLDLTFVSACGGLNTIDRPVNPDDTCRKLSENLGGTVVSLLAPAFSSTPEMCASLLAHNQIKSALEIASQSDLALVGIAEAHENSTDVLVGCFTVDDMRRLLDEGAVGHILGAFYDINGHMLARGMRDRVVALTEDDMRQIPEVVAIASEAKKGLALLGALRTGLINALITTMQNARDILQMNEDHPLVESA